MASLKLDLQKKTPVQQLALGDDVAAKCAPVAPATPPLPNMAAKVATMVVSKTSARTANDNYESARTALVGLKEVRDARMDTYRADLKAVAAQAEAEAKGNAALLAATGFPLAADSTQSTQPPDQVTNLSITAGDNDGTLDGQHDPAARAKSYEVQLTTVDPVTGPWTTKAQPTSSRWWVEGLTSGQRLWIRVRGIGSNGQGPWSDPATKIVP